MKVIALTTTGYLRRGETYEVELYNHALHRGSRSDASDTFLALIDGVDYFVPRFGWGYKRDKFKVENEVKFPEGTLVTYEYGGSHHKNIIYRCGETKIIDGVQKTRIIYVADGDRQTILNALPSIDMKMGITPSGMGGAGRVGFTLTLSGGDYDKVQALAIKLSGQILAELPTLKKEITDET